MAIVYKLLPDGAFVAGDTEARLTCYAYPTSPYAVKARKIPQKIAAAMIKGETLCPCPAAIRDDYDARNWARLNA